MADEPSINEAEVAKALLQDYAGARQEALLHIQLYKAQFRNVGGILALAGFLLPLLISQSLPIPPTNYTIPLTGWILLLILFTISTAEFSIVFSLLSDLFALQVLAERCVYLEDRINRCLRGPYLLWERFASQILERNEALLFKMPDTALLLLSYVFLLFFGMVLPMIGALQILCSPSTDRVLTIATTIYASYVLAAITHAFYVNTYIVGRLRSEFRRLFESAISGRINHSVRSDPIAPIFVVLVTILGTCAVVALPTKSDVCKYIGGRFMNHYIKSDDHPKLGAVEE